jgi:hypothetical protein
MKIYHGKFSYSNWFSTQWNTLICNGRTSLTIPLQQINNILRGGCSSSYIARDIISLPIADLRSVKVEEIPQ